MGGGVDFVGGARWSLEEFSFYSGVDGKNPEPGKRS